MFPSRSRRLINIFNNCEEIQMVTFFVYFDLMFIKLLIITIQKQELLIDVL